MAGVRSRESGDRRRKSGDGRPETGVRCRKTGKGCRRTIKSKCNVTQSASEGSVDVGSGGCKTPQTEANLCESWYQPVNGRPGSFPWIFNDFSYSKLEAGSSKLEVGDCYRLPEKLQKSSIVDHLFGVQLFLCGLANLRES